MEIITLSTSAQSESNCFDYVSITGDDASSFLQGQVTCNLDLLTVQRSLIGALCNLKGRVVADFRLFRLADDEIILQTRRGVGQSILDTLSRYAVFSRVELQLVNGPLVAFGIIGSSASAACGEVLPEFPDKEHAVLATTDYLIVRIPGTEPRYQLWCHNDPALAAIRKLDVMEEEAPVRAWHLADIQAGIVHVSPQLSERYTPQLLNYDVSGVVDFEKGCYTGQEVVARMHYRATAKKRLFRLRSEGLLQIDSQVVTAANEQEPVAEILTTAPADENGTRSEALAIMKTELVASQPDLLLWGQEQQPVRLGDLPYRTE